MDISNLRTTLDPSALSPGANGAASSAAPASGASTGASGSGSPVQSPQNPSPTPSSATVSASTLHQAVKKINQQLEQSSGVTLSAGLDTTGSHPGQVLVELSDKATRQTFFKYYVPAQQVVQASENLGSGSAAAGALISAKA